MSTAAGRVRPTPATPATAPGTPPPAAPGATPPAGEHRVDLPGSGGEWSVWRCAALRGAGFAADGVLGLAVPGSARAADAALEAAEAAAEALESAKGAVNEALDALRAEGAWDDRTRRKPLMKAFTALDKGRAPAEVPCPHAAAAVARFRAAAREADAAGERYRRRFREDRQASSARLHAAAADPRFQEAVLWQNRHAYHTALRKLLAAPPGGGVRNSQRRQHEELVASYLQRYSVKNDSIGFFGPVGWADIDDAPGVLDVAPGADLLAQRTVYLEAWCLDALAANLAANPALRPWMVPERLPFLRVDDGMLHLPSKPPAPIPPPHAALLAACDGARNAEAVARALTAGPVPAFRSVREVYLALERLRSLNLIEWGFRVPVQPRAELALRRILEGVGDEGAGRGGLDGLARLEARAADIARAACNVEALDAALRAIEDEFRAITGAEATRSAGKTYAARTLVYEDCRRDVAVRVGGDLLAGLGPPLALLLRSARWYTWAVAERYRAGFHQIHDALARETGVSAVDGVRFWYRAQSILFEGDEERALDAVRAQFQRMWAAIVGEDAGDGRISVRSDDIRAAVEAAFPAPRPGWQGARYHSPDLMIAAADVDSARRDPLLVLGEIHVGVNTLNSWVFMAQHPDFPAVTRWIDADLPDPRIVPVAARHWPTLTTRTQVAHVSSRDYCLASAHGAADVARTRVLHLSDLVVAPDGGDLVARTRDGRLRFDLMEVFADVLAYMVNESFRLLPPAPHTPRVTVDRLVVCREAWRFPAAELEFAQAGDPEDRFLGARRWRRDHGLPRFLFARAPVEKKPFFLDLESALYVDLFARVIRRTTQSSLAAQPVSVAEMLPTPHMAWLPDAQGRRYTSELRVVAVDRSADGP